VGTLFSLAQESGYPDSFRQKILDEMVEGTLNVRTDGRASPTGFPFKVLELDGTLADEDVYQERKRICDLGYLQNPYVDGRGNLRGRCPSEPEEDFVRKEGDPEETEGRQCLCNALMSNVGQGQVQSWGEEPPLFTGGDQFEDFPLEAFDELPYSAKDVINYLRPNESVSLPT
jgi:NAD(P)H-dependent flavin oxidoreductase YrpB (nitropropane dioxygenase family)